MLGESCKRLNLTVVVDNSIVEVFANDHFAVTTRVCVSASFYLSRQAFSLMLPCLPSYPWLDASVGAGLLARAGTGEVVASKLELWDGLGECIFWLLLLPVLTDVRVRPVNAWPDRPANTSKGLRWSVIFLSHLRPLSS